MQKTQWRSRISSRKLWWLDDSRSQGPERHLRISKQSSICSRGAGSSHSMDPDVSVQKQNFTRNPAQLAKVPGAREETKSHLHLQFLRKRKTCEDLSWNHCTSTPHRSETNGIAERAMRRVKESTSAVLLQSGLNESWWADSMECYTCLRNVTDLLSDGKTSYKRRFGHSFKGPIIPFGSLVEHHHVIAKDQSRIHQSGKKVLPGLFLGYALYAGGIWKGDVLIVDLEELETMDASEIYSKRLNAKDVIFQKNIFPIADRRIKSLGWGQELRTPTLVRYRPIQGESNIDFLGESEGSLPKPQDSFPDAEKAMNDFWSMSGSFHISPSRWTQSQTLLDEKGIIPYSTEIHWRIQNYSYEFGCQAGKRIDDCWNIDGSRDLSDPWTGFTQFTLLDDKVLDGYM